MRDIDALLGFLAERLAMPFAWGRDVNDCVGFVLAAIEVQCGRDVLPGVHWSTERGAARVIRRLGGLEKAVSVRLPELTPAAAVRGDVAGIADTRFGVSLAIVEGGMLVAPGTRGLKRMPRSSMIRAWSADV